MGVSDLFKSYADKTGSNKVPTNVDVLCVDLNAVIHGSIPKGEKAAKSRKELQMRAMAKRESGSEDIATTIINKVKTKLAKFCTTVKPNQVVYIAVDGLAPMAKIAHQALGRSRVRKSTGFDTTQISPGTEFMDRLTAELSQTVKNGELYRPEGRQIDIRFSPHTIPGEGEHKIAKFLNDGNFPHSEDNNIVIVSPDADLVFISLISLRRNIYLMRPDLNFKNSKVDMFINIEALKVNIPNNRYADMTMLSLFVGNDFLPPCPSLMDVEDTINRIHETIDIMVKQNIPPIIEIHENRDFTVKMRSLLIACNALIGNDSDEINRVIFRHFQTGKMRTSDGYGNKVERDVLLNHPFKSITSPDLEALISAKDGGVAEASRIYPMWYIEEFDIKDKALFDVLVELDLVPTENGKINNKITQEDVRLIAHQYILGMFWVMRYYITAGNVNELWYYQFSRAPFGKDILDNLEFFTDFNHNITLGKQDSGLSILHQLCFIIPQSSKSVLPKELEKAIYSAKSSFRFYKSLQFVDVTEGRRQSTHKVDRQYTYKAFESLPPFEAVHALVTNLPNSVKEKYRETEIVVPVGVDTIFTGSRLTVPRETLKRFDRKKAFERGLVKVDPTIRFTKNELAFNKGNEIEDDGPKQPLKYVEEQELMLDELDNFAAEQEDLGIFEPADNTKQSAVQSLGFAQEVEFFPDEDNTLNFNNVSDNQLELESRQTLVKEIPETFKEQYDALPESLIDDDVVDEISEGDLDEMMTRSSDQNEIFEDDFQLSSDTITEGNPFETYSSSTITEGNPFEDDDLLSTDVDDIDFDFSDE